MKKNLLLFIVTAVALFVAAVLWLLSVVLPEQFAFFNLNWAFVIICGTAGLALIFNAAAKENMVALKKFKIFLGALFLAAAAVSVVFALTLPQNYIWPIVAVVVTAAGLISVISVKGEKWDEGDNHKPGYKDYRTRKAEEAARLEEQKTAAPENKSLNDD